MQSEYLFFEGVDAETVAPLRRFAALPSPVIRDPAKEAGAFLSLLFGIADLPVKAYRGTALTRRLPACLRFLRADTPEHGSLRIWKDPALANAALNVVLLGVTSFFRDTAVFEHLERTVLPAILKRNVRPRIWSAACSDGQELYSVAMLLAEAKRLADCELVGSDCRAEAIDQAKVGSYQPGVLAQMNRGLRTKYFEESGTSARINAALRARVRWVVANLLRGVEKGPWHLILWRNMAIYLETAAAEGVWEQLCAQLEPGGYVVGGRADYPPKWLPLVRVGPCVYQKTSS